MSDQDALMHERDRELQNPKYRLQNLGELEWLEIFKRMKNDDGPPGSKCNKCEDLTSDPVIDIRCFECWRRFFTH